MIQPRQRFACSVSMLCTLALTPALFAGSARPTVLYVDDDALASGNGLTWSTAFRNLQDALAFAATHPSISEIHVAAGTYQPDRSAAFPLGSHDRSASFHLLSNVTILGGYFGLSAGGDLTPDTRNPIAAPTILSGDLLSDDDFSLAPSQFLNHADNAFHVVTALNITNAKLDGLAISAGYADGPDLGDTIDSQNQGAALSIFNSSLTLNDCLFTANFSANHAAVNDHGTTIYTNCVFSFNYADAFAAGLYLHADAHASLTSCRFDQNLTPLDGAGMFSATVNPLTITDCVFQNNNSDRGAGLFIAQNTSPVINNGTFQYNAANFGAGTYVDIGASPAFHGGMWCTNDAQNSGGGINNNFAFTTIDNAMFLGNTSAVGNTEGAGGGGGSGGAGFWTSGGAPVVDSCTFTQNFASFGAGFYANENADSLVINCSFADNQAGEGAGAYNLMSTARLANCTFTNNHVQEEGFPVGGAVSDYFSVAAVESCTFTDNSATLGGGAIYNEGSTPSVTSCVFVRNSAHNYFCGWGGAIMNSFDCHPAITNCSFVNNHADQGGAIFNTTFSYAAITNCTMAGNYSSGRVDGYGNFLSGGGVYNSDQSETTITNCILALNAPNDLDGITPAFSFTIMPGIPAGNHNISADPRFTANPGPGPDNQWMTADDEPGNLSLTYASPAIDAGDNTAKPLIISTDVANLPRFVDDPDTADTGSPDDAREPIDIGAYEFQPNPCSADVAPLNQSGLSTPDHIVDFLDLSAVILAWGSSGSPADINHDGVVDISDLTAVILHWGECP
ncbi:MAG TPA: choice-of-anchor Q domain-containing protein [Phycisphaerales bacterium]|nr:choice-of-anchor Q domain-containing protein [Phycisphaerales bacterium]